MREEKNVSIQDRRRSKRWNLKVPLRIFDAESDRLVGHVVDVSLRGMKITSKQPIAKLRVMSFDIELPDAKKQWVKTPISAFSVHCIEDEESQVFYTGFEFVRITPECLLGLQRLIDDLDSFS